MFPHLVSQLGRMLALPKRPRIVVVSLASLIILTSLLFAMGFFSRGPRIKRFQDLAPDKEPQPKELCNAESTT
ncbi:hypothetical protein HDU98_003715, partial [Podochytrium sp. JEL0797]